jgi:hypothetical protein
MLKVKPPSVVVPPVKALKLLATLIIPMAPPPPTVAPLVQFNCPLMVTVCAAEKVIAPAAAIVTSPFKVGVPLVLENNKVPFIAEVPVTVIVRFPKVTVPPAPEVRFNATVIAPVELPSIILPAVMIRFPLMVIVCPAVKYISPVAPTVTSPVNVGVPDVLLKVTFPLICEVPEIVIVNAPIVALAPDATKNVTALIVPVELPDMAAVPFSVRLPVKVKVLAAVKFKLPPVRMFKLFGLWVGVALIVTVKVFGITTLSPTLGATPVLHVEPVFQSVDAIQVTVAERNLVENNPISKRKVIFLIMPVWVK